MSTAPTAAIRRDRRAVRLTRAIIGAHQFTVGWYPRARYSEYAAHVAARADIGAARRQTRGSATRQLSR
ncbi:hypothetical protein GCM10010278_35600 [Streptomyces melanogenes]|nr:hypothetical protein GCM10010278_35600 [Streptomyces melanogenes]